MDRERRFFETTMTRAEKKLATDLAKKPTDEWDEDEHLYKLDERKPYAAVNVRMLAELLQREETA